MDEIVSIDMTWKQAMTLRIACDLAVLKCEEYSHDEAVASAEAIRQVQTLLKDHTTVLGPPQIEARKESVGMEESD